MAEFKSHTSFYDFLNSVSQMGYIQNIEQEEFLSAVLETSAGRRKSLDKNRILYRAQKHNEWEEYEIDEEEKGVIERPASKDRMKPLRDKAFEGRLNPKDISCLYTADKIETAVAEVRPYVGQFVSVAKLKVLKPLTLIDCIARKNELILYLNEPNAEERERSVWQNINEAFSIPVDPNEVKTNYVPTQIIAKMFKENGIDGLVYKSSLCNGINIALFDLDSAEVVDCNLFKVTSVEYHFEDRTQG